MGNCEKCNKSVYEKSLIFINDKFICLQCDDEHEEIIEFNHNKKFIDLLNEKINLLDNVENKYFHYLGGNFGVHVIFLENRTLFFYNDITEKENLFILHEKATEQSAINLIENELIFLESYPFISVHNIKTFNFTKLNTLTNGRD